MGAHGYVYLAAPYSHPDKRVQASRVERCAVAARNLLRHGTYPFSPLVHGHYIEQLGGGEVPWKVWMDHSFKMLQKAQTCYVLMLDGWQQSKGVTQEIEFAKQNRIPVSYLPEHVWCKVDMNSAVELEF